MIFRRLLSFAMTLSSVALMLSLWSNAAAKPKTPQGEPLNKLFGVTCLANDDCWAVGHRQSGPGEVQPTYQHWNGGSWSIVPGPNATPQEAGIPVAVTCNNSADCWAVGGNGNGQPLFVHWNGSAWSIVGPPTGSSGYLSSISCIGPSDCWAAGTTSVPGGGTRTLVLHWDGVDWSVVPSPNFDGVDYDTLSGISCPSANECWAVGEAQLDLFPLMLRWNGSAWTLYPLSNFDSPLRLNGVTCVSSSDCWAAGSYRGFKVDQPLYLHWNGSSWLQVPSASPFPNSEVVSGIACTSPSDCWSVGGILGPEEAFAQHWNGVEWPEIPVANPSSSFNTFQSVACVAANDCWAVGYTDVEQLIEHWNGTSWNVVPLAPTMTGAASRKMHGSAGVFDIPIPVAGPAAVECRSGGATGDHQLVLTFENPVTVNGQPQAQVTSGTGEIGSGGVGQGGVVTVTGNTIVVPLTNISDAQRTRVTLHAVSDGLQTGEIAVPLGMLLGDTNGNGLVTATDIAQTKSQAGVPISATSFRADVNANGSVTASDVGQVKANAGHTLP